MPEYDWAPILVRWTHADLLLVLDEARRRGVLDALALPEPLLAFDIIGKAAPQGSKKIVQGRGQHRPVLVESSIHVGPWRQAVAAAANEQVVDPVAGRVRQPYPLDEPITASVVFTVPKPASAPKTRRTWPDRMPDLSKLLRALEDGLTDGGVWRDDARVVRYRDLAKVYPREDPDALDVPGVRIRIWRTADLDLASASPARPRVEPADLTLFGGTTE